MADPGAAVEVHGAVAVDGAVAKNDPDMLVAQIEQTRDDLARTIDSLAERVSPARNLRMLGDTVREKASQQLARPEVRMGAAAAGAAVVGIAVLRFWLKHRGK
jgi:GrpB-like predicted nucleotidyltransferase (UPF0157 family)